MTTASLKEKLLKEIQVLNHIDLTDYFFEETDGTGKEGIFIYSDNRGSYIYVQSERGNIVKRKVTDSLFEISFWFVNSIAIEIAINDMGLNFKQGENYREKLFKKQLEILGQVNENYKKAGEIEIDEILKENPL